MKIMYLTPAIYNSAGTERVLSIKANYLTDQCGYEVVIVTTDQKERPSFYHFNDCIKLYDLGLNYIDDYRSNIVLKLINHYIKNRKYKKQLQKLIDKERPDVCVSLGGKEVEFLGSMRLNSKKVLELHFAKNIYYHFVTASHKGFLWKLIGKIQTKLLVRRSQLFDRLVVLTKDDLNAWKETNTNVIQIYNPLPYESEQVSNLSRKDMIAVGRLSAQKNFTDLILAWAIVSKMHPDWVLNIWGEGEDKNILLDLIHMNGLESVVKLNGVTSSIGQEYLKSSAYIMTSKYEGFPMVLLEASSFGLPLISYDCECGPRDIIQNGKNGYLVPFGDIEKLAVAICEVIENKELLHQMGKEAKKKSLNYSKNNILPLWPKFFASLLVE